MVESTRKFPTKTGKVYTQTRITSEEGGLVSEIWKKGKEVLRDAAFVPLEYYASSIKENRALPADSRKSVLGLVEAAGFKNYTEGDGILMYARLEDNEKVWHSSGIKLKDINPGFNGEVEKKNIVDSGYNLIPKGQEDKPMITDSDEPLDLKSDDSGMEIEISDDDF